LGESMVRTFNLVFADIYKGRRGDGVGGEVVHHFCCGNVSD
jgi:hypothetical protein